MGLRNACKYYEDSVYKKVIINSVNLGLRVTLENQWVLKLEGEDQLYYLVYGYLKLNALKLYQGRLM